MDKKEYKKYKRRIAQTEAKIDNKAPPFHVAYYYDKHNMRSHLTRIREIDRENMTILRRINIIVRFGVRIRYFISRIFILYFYFNHFTIYLILYLLFLCLLFNFYNILKKLYMFYV